MSRGGQWWVDVPRVQWPKDKAFKKEVLSRIGLHIYRVGVKAALEACLLTPAEMAAGTNSW